MTYPDPYGAYPAHRPVAQPKRKRRFWPWVLAGIVALCAFGGVASAAISGSQAGKPVAGKATDIAKAVQPATTSTAKAKSTEPADEDGDGMPDGAFTRDGITYLPPGDYDVAKTFNLPGNQIRPGTYTVQAADGHCYWERLRNFDGELNSIIANDNIEGKATARVTVKKTDKGFHLGDGCLAGIRN